MFHLYSNVVLKKTRLEMSMNQVKEKMKNM